MGAFSSGAGVPPAILCSYPNRLLTRRRMISLPLDFLGLRVLPPLAWTPVGPAGGRLPLERPEPPPMGWAWWLLAMPRVIGRRPRWRVIPALPRRRRRLSGLPVWPMVA